jgi:SAM-dependent methyltransferase
MKTLLQPIVKTQENLTSDQLYTSLKNLRNCVGIEFDSITDQLKKLPSSFLKNTIQGQALLKPFGYAGDFLIIDKIYTRHINHNIKFGKWDKFIHSLEATQAVRNRKTYFRNLMKRKLENGRKVSLLNLASGPARDLLEVYNTLNSPSNLITTCIDMDEQAIQYAKILNHDYLDQVCFINKNVFRFNAKYKYDVIWSAGLFDYFNDKAFLFLLNSLKSWLKPGGEIIIGNFNADHNPSKKFMEKVCEWELIHRTPGQLVSIATQAGFNLSSIRVGAEPLNVNLFLHLKAQDSYDL